MAAVRSGALPTAAPVDAVPTAEAFDGVPATGSVGGRLAAAEWERGGGRMDVRLDGTAENGLPRRAVFRDWSGYTELELNLERVDEVEPYPPDIWSPGY